MRPAFRLIGCQRVILATLMLVFGSAFCAPSGNRTNAQDLQSARRLTDHQIAAIKALPRVPANLNRGFGMKRSKHKKTLAQLGITVNVPSFETKAWVFAMPKPPQTDGQDVLLTETVPKSDTIVDLTEMRREIQRSRVELRWSDDAHVGKFQCNYAFQIYNRKLAFGREARGKAAAAPLKEEDKQLYLRPAVDTDYTELGFQQWKSKSDLTRQKREGEIKFGQRVFRTLVTTYGYHYVPGQNRSATELIKTNRTDCGGLSTLFVTAMRSAGIPARTLVGRWAESAQENETVDGQPYHKYHVIAEFYAQGVGWVPVDVSSAILHDRTEQRLQYFGNDPGNFITLHIDTQVKLDTVFFGEYETAFCQIPLYWFRGSGSIEDRELTQTWNVQ